MVVSYQFYTDVYDGSYVSESEFTQYSRKALQFINELSASRLLHVVLSEEDEKLVKLAVCALCDYDKENDERIDKISVSSETVRNHTKSFNTAANSKNNKEIYNERVQLVYGYLLPTNLLYRGI